MRSRNHTAAGTAPPTYRAFCGRSGRWRHSDWPGPLQSPPSASPRLQLSSLIAPLPLPGAGRAREDPGYRRGRGAPPPPLPCRSTAQARRRAGEGGGGAGRGRRSARARARPPPPPDAEWLARQTREKEWGGRAGGGGSSKSCCEGGAAPGVAAGRGRERSCVRDPPGTGGESGVATGVGIRRRRRRDRRGPFTCCRRVWRRPGAGRVCVCGGGGSCPVRVGRRAPGRWGGNRRLPAAGAVPVSCVSGGVGCLRSGLPSERARRSCRAGASSCVGSVRARTSS